MSLLQDRSYRSGLGTLKMLATLNVVLGVAVFLLGPMAILLGWRLRTPLYSVAALIAGTIVGIVWGKKLGTTATVELDRRAVDLLTRRTFWNLYFVDTGFRLFALLLPQRLWLPTAAVFTALFLTGIPVSFGLITGSTAAAAVASAMFGFISMTVVVFSGYVLSWHNRQTRAPAKHSWSGP